MAAAVLGLKGEGARAEDRRDEEGAVAGYAAGKAQKGGHSGDVANTLTP